MFKKPFEFTGRIHRKEYILSVILVIALYVAFYYVFYFLDEYSEEFYSAYAVMGFILLWIPSSWFFLAQSTKRCHDRGNSGLYLLIPLYVFVLLVGDSDYGINKYGLNPKELGNFQEMNSIGKEMQN